MSPETSSDLETQTRKNYNFHNAMRGRGPQGGQFRRPPAMLKVPPPPPRLPRSTPSPASLQFKAAKKPRVIKGFRLFFFFFPLRLCLG